MMSRGFRRSSFTISPGRRVELIGNDLLDPKESVPTAFTPAATVA